MQINPFKGTIVLHQILNMLKLALIQAGICDEQDAPVDISGILKRTSDIFFGSVGKTAHHHAAYCHLTLFQHKDRVQQQRIAEDLYPL